MFLLSSSAEPDTKKASDSLMNAHSLCNFPQGYPPTYYPLSHQIIRLRHTYTLVNSFRKGTIADLLLRDC